MVCVKDFLISIFILGFDTRTSVLDFANAAAANERVGPVSNMVVTVEEPPQNVNLQFDPISQDSIMHYKVAYTIQRKGICAGEFGSYFQETKNTTKTTVDVQYKPCSNYKFEVTPYNSLGSPGKSAVVTFATTDVATIVKGVTATVQAATGKFLLHWTISKKGSCPLDGFFVIVKPMGNPNCSSYLLTNQDCNTDDLKVNTCPQTVKMALPKQNQGFEFLTNSKVSSTFDLYLVTDKLEKRFSELRTVMAIATTSPMDIQPSLILTPTEQNILMQYKDPNPEPNNYYLYRVIPKKSSILCSKEDVQQIATDKTEAHVKLDYPQLFIFQVSKINATSPKTASAFLNGSLGALPMLVSASVRMEIARQARVTWTMSANVSTIEIPIYGVFVELTLLGGQSCITYVLHENLCDDLTKELINAGFCNLTISYGSHNGSKNQSYVFKLPTDDPGLLGTQYKVRVGSFSGKVRQDTIEMKLSTGTKTRPTLKRNKKSTYPLYTVIGILVCICVLLCCAGMGIYLRKKRQLPPLSDTKSEEQKEPLQTDNV